MSDIIFIVFGLFVISFLYYVCNEEYKEYLNDCNLLEKYFKELEDLKVK